MEERQGARRKGGRREERFHCKFRIFCVSHFAFDMTFEKYPAHLLGALRFVWLCYAFFLLPFPSCLGREFVNEWKMNDGR